MLILKKSNSYFFVILISLIMGIVGGTVGAAFYHTLHFVSNLRSEHNWLIYFLALGGLLSVLIYKLLNVSGQGINNVFSATKKGETVSPLLSLAIFLGTAITQLFGGSAGKEGAAIQIGGSISSFLVERFNIDGENKSVGILSGIAAVFSAVFAAPLTALAFALEIVFINRKFYFKAILPITVSSLSAFAVSQLLGVSPAGYDIGQIPKFSISVLLKAIIVILICVGGCLFFCLSLHTVTDLFDRIFKNRFLRIAAGGIFIIALTMLVGNQDYNGGGMEIISQVLKTGKTVWFAFLLKILFTAITNAAGYKGGEIVPSLFIGATLGATIGGLIGFNPVFSAALGMITVFCGATKCTVAALMLSIEFFGISGVGYFIIAVTLSRLSTFNIGLYTHNKTA